LSSFTESLLIIFGSILVSVAGLFIVRKLCKPEVLRRHHELAGNVLAVIGTLNAILLGLVVVEAQSRFQQARTNEAAEASAVADLRMCAEYLSEPTRSAIGQHVCKYVKLTRDVEWNSPPSEQPNKQAVEEYHCIWKLVCEYNAKDGREQNLQTAMITSLQQGFDLRRLRITTGRHGLPVILWVVMIASSITTIAFTYFFAGESFRVQAMMVAALSVSLSMSILVVFVLGNPYVGDWKIHPDQFERITTKIVFPITSNSKPFAIDNQTLEPQKQGQESGNSRNEKGQPKPGAP